MEGTGTTMGTASTETTMDMATGMNTTMDTKTDMAIHTAIRMKRHTRMKLMMSTVHPMQQSSLQRYVQPQKKSTCMKLKILFQKLVDQVQKMEYDYKILSERAGKLEQELASVKKAGEGAAS